MIIIMNFVCIFLVFNVERLHRKEQQANNNSWLYHHIENCTRNTIFSSLGKKERKNEDDSGIIYVCVWLYRFYMKKMKEMKIDAM